MRRKIKILVVGLLLLLGIQTMSKAEEGVRTCHLTGPVERVIIFKGKEYLLKLYRYEPPYLSPPYLLKDRSKTDFSTPEKTYIAYESAVRRDREWFLSTLCEEYREDMGDGKNLIWDLKGTPVSDPITDGPFHEKWLFKAEYTLKGILYQTVVGHLIYEGKEIYSPSLSTFVKEDGKWLKATSQNPVGDYLKLNTYDEIMEKSKEPEE